MSSYLFVYGTLQTALNTEMAVYLAAHASFVSKGTIQAQLYKISWFPGVVLSPVITDRVYGTLFQIESAAVTAVFDVLDAYEGADAQHSQDSLFIRKLVTVSTLSKQQHTAWVYLYNRPIVGLERILSGDFLAHTSSQN